MVTPPNGIDDPLDVLIIGAGLSGIGCGCYLRRTLPGKRFAILEARGDLGGTWDLFRYPGIRSDSDLFTFGYDFKPWLSGKAIAHGADIQAYIREAATEHGVNGAIRFHHTVRSADWDSALALWKVQVERTDTGESLTLCARWLFCATGYYNYDQGFRPHFTGEETYRGRLVHPQHWPEDLDYAGKRVAVIGSGATAVTLVPALAETAAHVTQIQRTPSYVLPVPAEDRLNKHLRRYLPEQLAYALTRRKNVLWQRWIYLLFQRYPKAARRLIRRANRRVLPEGYPVDVHFNPPYEPWDQRLCAVPDGDFFEALSRGRASIVTGTIASFTETGIRMDSGEEIAADIVVTATGLNLRLFGGASLSVDGRHIEPSERLVFKGMMLDEVPNFSFAVGYTNSSWTLKVGLLCQYFCRLLELMDEKEAGSVVARPDRAMTKAPLLDFGAGYVKRSLAQLPRQGDSAPWTMTFNYIEDARQMRRGSVDDPALHFSRPPAARVVAA